MVPGTFTSDKTLVVGSITAVVMTGIEETAGFSSFSGREV